MENSHQDKCYKSIDQLSIYGNRQIENTSSTKFKDNQSKEVYFHGLGQKVLGLLTRTKGTANNFRAEFTKVKDYALTTEGKLKLSAIAMTTGSFGIYGLFTVKSRLKRILYPICGLALSSAVCYPSPAYKIAKESAFRTHQFTQTGWVHSKYGIELLYDKYCEKFVENNDKQDEQEDVLELGEEVADGKDNVAKSMDVPNVFEDKNTSFSVSPNIEVSNQLTEDSKDMKNFSTGTSEHSDNAESTKKITMNNNIFEAVKELEDTVKPVDPNKDFGQSNSDDKELYTTRS